MSEETLPRADTPAGDETTVLAAKPDIPPDAGVADEVSPVHSLQGGYPHEMEEHTEANPWHGVTTQEEQKLIDEGSKLTGFRRSVFDLVTWKHFDDVILCVIAINCISMAIYDPKDTDNTTTRNQVIESIEYVLLGIFTGEMLIKWVAFGIQGYFSVGWNILDCIVVVVAWAAFIPGVGNYSVLRLLKALRPLRTMGKSGGMQRIINVMFKSIKQLFDTFMLCCLVFFVFGIVGVQLFQGKLTQHCFSSSTGALYVPPGDEQFRNCGGRYTCPSGYFCGVGKSSDYKAQGLSEAGNPAYGVTSFDDIGHAFLSIFVAITLEGWVDVMYNIQDAYSDPVSTIFFLLLILLGSLFVLNLALAVVADEYDAQAPEEDEEDEEEPTDETTYQPAETDPILTKIAMSGWFNNLIFVFIVLNTVTLSCEHSRTRIVCPDSIWTSQGGRAGTDGSCISQAVEMDSDFNKALEYFNYVFIGVFTVEMLVKIVGLGPRIYVSDRFNIFDAVIVVFSYIELAFSNSSSLSALRTFRLGRVFKMAKSWDSLRQVIETVIETLPNMGYLSIVLLLFMFIASVGGMQMFGGKLGSMRSNYDDFLLGMLTTFQILSGENWNEILYDAINSTSYGAMVYFLLVVIVGQFLILNLFLAILLSKFTCDAPEYSIDAAIEAVRSLCSAKVTPDDETAGSANNEEEEVTNTLEKMDLDAPGEDRCRLSIAEIYTDETKRLEQEEKKHQEAGCCGPADPDKPLVLTGDSLFILSPTNPVRVLLGKMVDTSWFQNTILAAIVISSLSLAMDEPGLDEDSGVGQFLLVTNWIFTIMFTVELLIKVTVYGFLFTPNAYLKDGWNVLDCFIVIISNVSLYDSGSGGSLKALRALRALRPLRTIKRAPGLRVVVDALLACMPSFVNISIVSFVFYLVFAIMGVQFWAGKFWTCNDVSVDNVTQCVGTYVDDNGDTVDREWSNAPMNFDNVLNGLLTLFEVASLELWLDVMYSAMDVSSTIGDQPERNQSGYFALYFVLFVIIGSFLVLNLFVGAVVDQFTQAKAETGHSLVLTEDQESFVDGLKMMVRQKPFPKPKMPQGTGTWIKFRQLCFKICMWDRTSPHYTGVTFDWCVSSLIVINVIIMSMYVWEPPSSVVDIDSTAAEDAQESTYNDVLEILNYVFTWIFFIEMVIKLIALGCYKYWKDDWNKLDGIVVLLSLASFITEVTVGAVTDINPTILRVCRAFRIIRIFRLLKSKSGRGVLSLLETLVISLPALANVSALLLLVIFIFSCLGMSFFGDMDTGPGQTGQFEQYPYKLYNEHANFTNFYRSFLLLFRVSTGESWNGIMHDCMVHSYTGAWVYWLAYMVIVAYLLFNLLIAIVLEEFSNRARQETLHVTANDIANFVECWRRLDPECTHYIKDTELTVLIKALEPPLGMDNGSLQLLFLQDSLYIPSHNGRLHFVEVFTALLKNAYGTSEMNQIAKECVTAVAYEAGLEFETLYGVEDSGCLINNHAAQKIQATLAGRDVRLHKAEGTGKFAGKTGNKPGASEPMDDSSKFTSKVSPMSEEAENPAVQSVEASPESPVEMEENPANGDN